MREAPIENIFFAKNLGLHSDAPSFDAEAALARATVRLLLNQTGVSMF